MDLSSRDMEEWLLASSEVRTVLGLTEYVPDHSTLTRTQAQLTIARLTAMQQTLLQKVEVEEVAVALDTTNFRLQHASAYYMTRTGRLYRDWVKGGYAVGIHSRLILATRSGRGLACGSDVPYLSPLRRQVARWMRRCGWVVIADAGFDGRATQPYDLIPVLRRNYDIKAPVRKARADLVAQARLDGLYGQRWQVETVHSVIKRKFGDTIRSRRRLLQFREPLLKALVYNIHV
jgi:hypothetical protein